MNTTLQTQAHCIPMNKVFANCSKEDEIYPLTKAEIAKAQQANDPEAPR
jgi:hypothetical protein